MADPIRADQKRQEQARTLLEMQHQRAVKDIDTKQKNDVTRIIARNEDAAHQLAQDFDVALETKREQYQQKLDDLKQTYDKRMAEATRDGEEQAERVKAHYAKLVARYREQGEKTVEETRRDTESKLTNIHKTAKKKGVET